MKYEPLKNPRTMADVEREYILRTLITLQWNRTHAAKSLGISIRTIRNKINQYRKEGYPTSSREIYLLGVSNAGALSSLDASESPSALTEAQANSEE